MYQTNPARKNWLHRLLDFVDNVINRFTRPRDGESPHQSPGHLLLLACALCLIGGNGALAQQIMPADKAAALRQSFPKTDIERWNKLFADPKTVLYTDAEILPAYQHADRGLLHVGRGGSSIGQNSNTSFHWVGYNISADPNESAKGPGRGGNGNIEFPWRTPGGVDKSENAIGKFRFFRLPDAPGGKVYPVAYFPETLGGSRMGRHRGMAWIFPTGTVFGEVLALRDSVGELNTFEVRLRIRQEGYWDIEILRPFPTSGDLESALKERGLDQLAAKIEAAPVQTRTLRDRSHPTQVAFVSTTGSVELPAIDPDLAKTLLNDTPFKSAVGAKWKGEASAPTSLQNFGIVPKEYFGTHLGTDTDSCMECHKHTLRHVDTFDVGRDWYGYVRGSDGIFTWHPIDQATISRSGSAQSPRIRADFIRAGWVAPFDPAVHRHDRYHLLEATK
jgi:hypothetical protein